MMFKLIAMLILLVIAGVALIIWAWLTLRVGRRQARRTTAQASVHADQSAATPDDWASKSLVPTEPNDSGEQDSDEASESDRE